MLKIHSCALLCLLSISTLTLAQSVSLPAFPGAEGFGSTTVGGRGGKVIKVTNLKDSGPGSLRAALEYEGPRIIVFATGGIINLETKLVISQPYVTIAGQTAPGSGICLRGESLKINTHNVVVRYLRIRPGDINFGIPNNWSNVDGISIMGDSSVNNILIDHCSISWAVDENIGIWDEIHDVTVQNCIISEALHRSKHTKGPHSMGMLMGSKATNISVHHNIFAHNNDRNPYINGHSFVDFLNNIIYNPGGVATDIAIQEGQTINYINNYFIPGPNTTVKAEVTIRNSKKAMPDLYLNGNMSADGSFRIAYYQDDNISFTSKSLPDTIERAEASAAPAVTTHTAEQALKYVLLEAGATLPVQDPVDRKIIRDITNKGAGIVNTKHSLLSWPPYDPGVAPLDTDEDGMPDYWEESFGLDANIGNDSADDDKDGYTNIEEYLNNTNPNVLEADFFSVKRKGSGNTTHLAFSSHHPKFSIDQNFPNPMVETTNVAFSIDRPSQVFIKVFNAQGEEVSELVNGFLYEGKYQIIWDAGTLRKGIYHLLISSGNSFRSIKVIITR